MALHQLKVVIWKNLIIRKRHWFLTIIEAILPVTLFFLIAYGRSKITGLNKVEVSNPTFNYIDGINLDINVGNTYILYTPNNEFYSDIISKMHAKLGVPSDQVQRFGTEDALLEYYLKNPNYTTIGVIFNGKDQKHFNYKIRYHEPDIYHEFLQTRQKYSNVFSFAPQTGGPYKNQPFLPIQMALDMSFLEYNLHREDIEKDISLYTLEFPYPPYKIDSAITTIFLDLLPLITLFSFIFICPAVLKRVVEEKSLGTKELLKMVGMKSWMLWLGWFIYGIIPMIFAIICIIFFMKVPIFGVEYPLIEHSNGGILFIYLILYCSASITFCFAISSFFNKPTIALVTGILIWILSFFVPKYSLGLEESNQLSWPINMLLNLLPNMSLHFGYFIISVFEEREIGINWSNFYKSASGGVNEITMLNVFVMLIFDIFFYTFFTFYMDGVNPGKYGVRRSYLFPFQDLYKWASREPEKVKIHCETVRLENVEEGNSLEKGIEISHLSKKYGPKVAVHDLNLDIYKNQITVLLGHNGAGKTTAMSMITGMIGSNSGTIKIHGLDIKRNIDEIRQSLGLCPQHNLLFTDLTVKEHLLFFALLKGRTRSDANREVDDLLKRLNIFEKKDSMAHTLSGGMQRKLCLGMALVGGSKVLILDEPSSGMDVESRRQLWDLLLKWRGEKTILITTHFMEEADALGDWIAIMSDGSLSCYGTPMYLKKKYDTGYHLSLMINSDNDDRKNIISKIESEVLTEVREAQIKSIDGNNIVFVLPFEMNSQMTMLLGILEEKKVDLNIDNISVTVTTLEDVFFKTRAEGHKGPKTPTLNTQESRDTNLYIRNWKPITLFTKKINFFVQKKRAYIVPFLVALVFFSLTGYLSRTTDYYIDNGPEFKLNLNSYGQTAVYYNGTETKEINGLMNIYKKLVESQKSLPFKVENVEQAILQKSKENIAYYKEHMVAGASIIPDTTGVKLVALYNAIATHSLPIALNLLTDSLAKTLLGPEYSISLSNWPLPSVNNVSPQNLSETKTAILWLVMLPIGCLFLLGSFILFPHTEISTKFVRIQYMCGVKPVVYWLVNFVADFSLYLVAMTLLTLFLWAISPMMRYTSAEIGHLFLIFTLYGFAGIPYTYLFSRKKSVSNAFAFFIIKGMFLGIILSILSGILIESQDEYYIKIGTNLKYFCFLFIPQVALCDGLVNFARRAVSIYNFEVGSKRCHALTNPCCIENSFECEKYKNYSGIYNEHLLLLGSFVIYMLINIMLDTYWIMKILSKLRTKLQIAIHDIRKKGRKPQSSALAIVTSKEQDKNTLKANHLGKFYSGRKIINNIDLTLEDGQCLGILGVNGAGKTTTFRMLTREEVVDEGSVQMRLQGKVIDIGNDTYMDTLGYCPQMDSLNFVLTGRQILTTIAKLRGVNDPENVNRFLEIFELTEHADKPCGYYSGGNKRKLSLAVSLIGFRKFVLLDEPTNGVDPSSRRKCWELIKAMQQNKHLSFILTSHSMMECEALCNELKIMKEGKFVVEGNLANLKKLHGGFSLKIKLRNKNNLDNKDDVDEVDGSSNSHMPYYKFTDVDDLKEHFTKDDRGEIKDEHSGLLHFYIKEKEKTWSKIFKEVEEIKASNPHLIEDYAISEASLEDIFLEVARVDGEGVHLEPRKPLN